MVPVSVKTRIGFNEVVTESWIASLLETPLSAITVHGRTQKMMSDGLADWDEIAKAAALAHAAGSRVRILGNGDVTSMSQARQHIADYGLDGVMVGTGIFRNPWMFNDTQPVITTDDQLRLLERHIRLFSDTWQERKHFAILKRFFKIYVHGFAGAAAMRERLMGAGDAREALDVILL